MKKISIFFTVLITVMSCSKNSDNINTFGNNSAFELNGAGKLSLISRDTMVLSKYLIYKPLTAHEKDSLAKMASKNSTLVGNAAYVTNSLEGPEYTDYSGQIHFQVFSATSSLTNHPIISISVTSNYAMVGGGALVYGYSGNGAFLTESRPINSTTWEGQSKDHIIPDPHYLKVYAIGMRIDNVDPNYLRSKIHITSNTSSFSNSPWTTVNVTDNCILIGGGAFDDYGAGYGNMLTSSNPSGVQWQVSGQAYRRSDPTQITAYAIGIENISYPTVGYLQTTVHQTTVPISSGPGYCYSQVFDGYALTCPGGVSTNHLTGRMLVGLYPQDLFPGAQAISKDTPGFADYGNLSAYALGIQKRPY
jgi:hypothetical protein